jgi:hypothetical protein
MCLDSFLFLFTILPLRIIIAVGQWVFARLLRTGYELIWKPTANTLAALTAEKRKFVFL